MCQNLLFFVYCQSVFPQRLDPNLPPIELTPPPKDTGRFQTSEHPYHHNMSSNTSAIKSKRLSQSQGSFWVEVKWCLILSWDYKHFRGFKSWVCPDKSLWVSKLILLEVRVPLFRTSPLFVSFMESRSAVDESQDLTVPLKCDSVTAIIILFLK